MSKGVQISTDNCTGGPREVGVQTSYDTGYSTTIGKGKGELIQ